jgi:glycosyltransferase involved in cell wall biosynthesis
VLLIVRVLVVTGWYPPIQSGSSFYAESLALGLRKHGHTVIVVSTDVKSKTYSSQDKDGITVHRIPAYTLPRLPFFLNLEIVPFSYTPANLRYLLDIARTFKPDVIHQVNHIFDTVFLSAQLSKRLRIPLVCSITTPIQHSKAIINWMMRIVDRGIIGIYAARRWSRVICLDNEVLRYVRETYGKVVASRCIVIAYGIRGSFHKAVDTEVKVSTCPSHQIIMVGHIHALRDPTNLVRAMPIILKRFPHTRLIFAGRVQYQRPVLESNKLGISESVDFLGEINHDEISELLRTSHVFAGWASGPYTGLGTAAIEAMICGTPLVIDLPENLFGEGILKNWENIVLVNRNDVKEIAESILMLLENKDLRKSIGIKGSRFVQQQLSWDKIVDEIGQVYTQINQDVIHS